MSELHVDPVLALEQVSALQELAPPLLGFGVHLQTAEYLRQALSNELASSHLFISEHAVPDQVHTPSVPSNAQLVYVM